MDAVLTATFILAFLLFTNGVTLIGNACWNMKEELRFPLVQLFIGVFITGFIVGTL
jgi:hypothetical protein